MFQQLLRRLRLRLQKPRHELSVVVSEAGVWRVLGGDGAVLEYASAFRIPTATHHAGSQTREISVKHEHEFC
jgi:hypothetical protein